MAYTFLFPAELKGWYLSGFVSIYILAFSLICEFVYGAPRAINSATSRLLRQSFSEASLSAIHPRVNSRFSCERRNKSSHLFILTILIFIIIRNINPFDRIFGGQKPPLPPETFSAQIEVVDWIYRDAIHKDKPFAVYTYTPPVYDYQYQYLLWWRGINKYKLLPAEYSYKPGETSYLQYKDRFVSSIWKPKDAQLMYLIIEPDNLEFRVAGWMGNFLRSDKLETREFPSKVKVLFGSL